MHRVLVDRNKKVTAFVQNPTQFQAPVLVCVVCGILSRNIWISPIDNDERRNAHPGRQNAGQRKTAILRSGNNEAGNDSKSDDGKPDGQQTDTTSVWIPLAQHATQLAATQVADEPRTSQDCRDPICRSLNVEIVERKQEPDTNKRTDGKLNQLRLGLGMETE